MTRKQWSLIRQHRFALRNGLMRVGVFPLIPNWHDVFYALNDACSEHCDAFGMTLSLQRWLN